MFYRFSPPKKNANKTGPVKLEGRPLRSVRWRFRRFIFRQALTGKLVFYFGLVLLTAAACSLYLLGKGLYNLYQRPVPPWEKFQRPKSKVPYLSPGHLDDYLDSLDQPITQDSLNQLHSNP